MPSSLTRAAFLTRTIVPLLPRHGLTLEQLALFAADAALALEAAGLLATKPKPQPPNPLPELPPVVDGLPGGLPVVEDTIPAPEPEPLWKPTRDQVRAVTAAIALDREWFSLFFLSWDDAKQDRYITECHRRGLTHVLVLFSGGYRERFPYFDLWNDIPRLRRGLEKLLRARLIPVLVGANAELAQNAPRNFGRLAVTGLSTGLREGAAGRRAVMRAADDIATRIIKQWRKTLPQVADLLPMAIPAVEQNDFLTPEAQHALAIALAELLPDAYRAIWFTGDRCHGDHNRGTGPDGQPPKAWKPEPDENNPGKLKAGVTGYWPATPAHALWYQSDKWRDRRAMVDDLGDVSVRVDGRVQVPGKTAPYPGMERDVIFGEAQAEQILSGEVTYNGTRDVVAAALTVPGISGTGEGNPA